MKQFDMGKLSENIDRIAKYDISNNKVFGSAYYVYCNGKTIEKCYGTASLTLNTPITNTSIFRLASMTKPITAVATLILSERGLLSLEDSVDKYLPAFRDIEIIDAEGNTITPKKLPTIRNILSHTSGIVSCPDKQSRMSETDKKTLDNSIAFYVKSGLDFEPNTMQYYSGSSAFDVLTKIIEIVTRTDYQSFLQREIFAPCGMDDTTFVPSFEQEKRIVAMHNKTDDGNAVFQMRGGCIFEEYPCTHYLGGAGLVSTLQDYCNFAKMLLNQGETERGRILDEKTFLQLCQPQVPQEIMQGNERWGLGVRVITEDVYPYLPKGTFGWSGAYGSHFWIDPANKIFAVYMKNSKYDGGAGNESAVNFEKAVYSSKVI